MSDHARKGDDMLVALATKFDLFVEHYNEEKKNDKESREIFRGEIKDDIKSLRDAVSPVIKDHDLIMRGGKWFALGCASIWGVVKGSFYLKDHLK